MTDIAPIVAGSLEIAPYKYGLVGVLHFTISSSHQLGKLHLIHVTMRRMMIGERRDVRDALEREG